MQTATYLFSCCFNSDALLPRFKGSTLRGGLGHTLRKISCALRHQECRNCLLANTCAYSFLFEIDDYTGKTPAAHRPHPYVLIPPEDDQRSFCAGDTFSFSIVLFGRANDYLPHLVYAFQELGRQGLGKKSTAAGTFFIESVSLGRKTLYRKDGPLASPGRLQEISAKGPQEAHSDKISVICHTPLRLKHRNRLQDDLSFDLLIRAALRRISTLEHTYGDGEPALDYKGLVARAANVRTISGDYRWVDIERYSNRQQTGMLMGGLQGRLVYQGEGLAEFLPLLRYCETTHLGKQTSFGLGRIEVRTEDDF